MIFKDLSNQNTDYTYEDIKDITDVSILVDIACRTDDEDLADYILYTIESRYREHIVLNAEYKSIRELAFFSIDDYDDGVWLEIAENTIDGRICAMAICNLHSYEGTCGSFEWDNVIKVCSDDDLVYIAEHALRWLPKRALSHIKDKSRYKEIINGDYEVQAKRWAVEYIDDEAYLIGLAKNHQDPEVRSGAASKIEKQEVLVDIAWNDSDKYVCLAATKKIADENVLNNLALNHWAIYVRRWACRNVHDEDVLKTIALGNEDSELCLIAAGNIEDNEILAQIAEKSKFPEVLEYILKRHDGDPCVKKVVHSSSNENLRNKAIEQIFDNDVLEDIALNDSNSELRIKAIKRVFNWDVLETIAKTDSNDEIRKAAILNTSLVDIGTLKFISKNDSSQKNRSLAVFRLSGNWMSRGKPSRERAPLLSDDEFYWDIAKNENHADTCCIACESINNQDYLKDIFNSDADSCVRSVAIGKITDGDILKDAAFSDDDENVRISAIDGIAKHICDEDVLIKIAKTDVSPKVRKEACRYIKNESVLTEIVIRDKEKQVIDEAFKGINDDGHLIKIIMSLSPYASLLAVVKVIDIVTLVESIEKSSKEVQDRFCHLIADYDYYRNKFNQVFLSIHEEKIVSLIKKEHMLNYIFENNRYSISIRDVAKNSLGKLKSSEINVDEIQDSKILSDLAVNDKNSLIRYWAVCNMDLVDESILLKIALNDDDRNVRLAATSKVSNEEYLADIFKENKQDQFICALAISKIYDESILGNVLKEYSYLMVHKKAVISNKLRKIENRDILYDLAKKLGYFDNEDVDFILEGIDDEKILVDIAKNAKDGSMQAYAALKISDKSLLDVYDDLSFYAKEIVIPVTSNEELLNNVALNDGYEGLWYKGFSIREKAVENKCLTDRKVLYELAFNENFSLRSAAVRKITDADDLKSIISVEEDYRIINYAKERLRYLEYLNGNN